MRFINVAVEDENTEQLPENPEENQEPVVLAPNATEGAIEAVNNLDSTDPEKVIQVANYKEELAAIRAKNKETEEGDLGSTDDTSLSTDDGEGSDDTSEEDQGGEEPSGDDTSSEEPVDEEPQDATAEMGEDAPGKSEEQVAQEQFIVQNQKLVNEALESVLEMSKFHGMLEKRSDLGGINQATAYIITTALERNAFKCGYKLTATPALEDFSGYTGATRSTKELKVAIENFLETVWASIKKFFKAVWTWIMDMITTKRRAPAKQKSEEVKKLEELIAKLQDQAQKNDVLKQKDEERKKRAEKQELAASISKLIFKSSDNGSFSEMLANALQLKESVAAASEFTKQVVGRLQTIAMSVNSGTIADVDKFVISKNDLSGIHFNEYNRVGNTATYEAFTDEIVGGIAARFVFGGDDASKIADKVGIQKVVKELGSQGYKFVSTSKKSGKFTNTIPGMDQNELASLKRLVGEIGGCYSLLEDTQKNIEKTAAIFKQIFSSNQPASWSSLDEKTVAILQSQLNYQGLITTSLTAGYESASVQVNNYVNGVKKLLALLIS